MGSTFFCDSLPIIPTVDEYVKANRRNKKRYWDDFEIFCATI